MIRAVVALILAVPAFAQLRESLPYTTPEATAWRRTSTCAEVGEFLGKLARLPHAERLVLATLGETVEGRVLPLVLAGDPPPARASAALAGDRLRVLVNANIHGGEVEGKEAVQILLREIARGEHAELLADAAIVFVPIYNGDGNDRISTANRTSQNGPDGGVGERANAQGLDLNRDFVKAESPECAALLETITRWDPHLFLDLHTTNGSRHGYHLTYSPSLSTNVDPALDGFARETFLPEVRRALRDTYGFRAFDYGNFTGRDERQWITYDHRPRFGTNYVGLRNRVAVLSEAYSYLDYRERVEVTRAFVLETLRVAAARADELRAACAAADARVERGEARFGWDTTLAAGYVGDVLVGEVRAVEIEGVGTRRIAEPVWRAETMRVHDRFESRESVPLPAGWILPAPNDAAREALKRHGLWLTELTEDTDLEVEVFTPSAVKRSSRSFQGHHEVGVEGAWSRARRTAPAGAWIVSGRQPLGRVAAQLLEPESEDSLSTWNVFDGETRAAADDDPGHYPVWRLVGEVAAPVRRVPAYGTPGF